MNKTFDKSLIAKVLSLTFDSEEEIYVVTTVRLKARVRLHDGTIKSLTKVELRDNVNIETLSSHYEEEL